MQQLSSNEALDLDVYHIGNITYASLIPHTPRRLTPDSVAEAARHIATPIDGKLVHHRLLPSQYPLMLLSRERVGL